MPRCSHTYADSSQCRRIVSAEQKLCYSHDPSRASERKRNAACGGRAKASGELGRVKARLHTLADMVEEGQMDRADAAVISQIWGTYLRAVSVELRVREATELLERLEALEESLQANAAQTHGGNRWLGA
jgi:predicted trehalose synthase